MLKLMLSYLSYILPFHLELPVLIYVKWGESELKINKLLFEKGREKKYIFYFFKGEDSNLLFRGRVHFIRAFFLLTLNKVVTHQK